MGFTRWNKTAGGPESLDPLCCSLEQSKRHFVFENTPRSAALLRAQCGKDFSFFFFIVATLRIAFTVIQSIVDVNQM